MNRLALVVLALSLLAGYHYHARLNALQGQVEALESRIEAVELERQEIFQRWREIERSYRVWYEMEVEKEVGG